jgi:hypothetical protein
METGAAAQGDSEAPHPHLHIHQPGAAGLPRKAHYPSNRVSLESVIRTCISELGAAPLREDWDSILALNEGKFLPYRSWRIDPSNMPKPESA